MRTWILVAGYSGTPLARKLGLVAGSSVLLDGRPGWLLARPAEPSSVDTDLTENVVREYALGHGRVDVKVCAIDDMWSGLKT